MESTTQRVSPNAVSALKDALTTVFWAKRDLLDWLTLEVEDRSLLAGIDWLGPTIKRQSIGIFIDRVCQEPVRHRPLLLQLMSDVAAMEDFPQLEWLEDSAEKVAAARAAVERVRRYIKPHEEQLVAQVQVRSRITADRDIAARRRAVSSVLEELRQEHLALFSASDEQRRGYAFEGALKRLFDVFDLDARSSFRTFGGQIDGGFTLDNTHFLLEARWRQKPASRDDLTIFAAKVRGKAENTLGLFVSVEGFDRSGIEFHSNSHSPLVLVDGGDLLAVYEERISFPDLLRRKYRHAAMKGEIYLPVHSILGGGQ